MMEFLSKEVETLLLESLERSDDFPKVLAEKFNGLSAADDERLRSRIKVLCDNGYISIPLWAEGVPDCGRIKEKGYDYFHSKEVYIRGKLRKDTCFTLLDDESEKMLHDLSQSTKREIALRGNNEQLRILEYLHEESFIKLNILCTAFDDFAAFVSVTQRGMNYFVDKEKRIEEIMVLGDEAFVVNNNSIDKQYQYNLSGNTISNSPFQIGEGNTQNIDYVDIEEKLGELKREVASLMMTDEQRAALSSLIERAENGCKSKNGKVLKKVFNELWDFAKQAGSNLLAAYLACKFGLGQ